MRTGAGRARGVLAIAAAGNEGVNIDFDPVSPAGCSAVMAVAATTRQGAETTYTNIGNAVAISAPGGEDATAFAGLITTSEK